MYHNDVEIREYLDDSGRSPFAVWFGALDAQAAAKVTIGLIRLEMGNLSNAKPVGGGVMEHRINWGPGYRIYFGRDGDRLIILLAGGTKRRQQKDISDADKRWADYKQRKKGAG